MFNVPFVYYCTILLKPEWDFITGSLNEPVAHYVSHYESSLCLAMRSKLPGNVLKNIKQYIYM